MNLDLSNWHPTCSARGLVNTGHGLCIYCMDCGIIANVEAVGNKISPADACKIGKKDRKSLGKQSPGVDAGGVIE